ncbi:hypothetical protein NYG90_10495 [Helicobacter sp. XJK30-2]|uniref:Uncharacterized protein n=1 Tax=Helicobacter zhangjianzhongii TaxID=2974574 RepID=A0ACC6FV34_9HELI|nr:hypothetical protein [Helicobacter sp. XJK30-2]MDL0083083.1 hypothetical protein [Helicobacter sp. XJK30-2]
MNSTDENLADIRQSAKKIVSPSSKEANESSVEFKHSEPDVLVEQTFVLKIQEDRNDAEHSKNNAELLNGIYSKLIRIFFAGKRFWVWAMVFIVCFYINGVGDKDMPKCFDNPAMPYIQYFAKNTLYLLGGVAMILLSFPTAKGIRKLFREIIIHITKKS